MHLGRASEAAQRLSKENEVLSKQLSALKSSSVAGSGGHGPSAMETGKVPAENNNNASPMKQQAGEQDAVSKEPGEQDKKVDEMKLKFEFKMQPDRQEKGLDGQIKVDEQELPAGQAAPPGNPPASPPGSPPGNPPGNFPGRKRGVHSEKDECADPQKQKLSLPGRFGERPMASDCPTSKASRDVSPRDLPSGFIGVVPVGSGRVHCLLIANSTKNIRRSAKR
ncbi:unnamed protein product [Polarella glacialis]|uniref:Uncharacterized protein n=1 Tax=Polarella glacialis TaxID=89957 RepID=A0A813GM17_POLGL|nr:unnamed protein product [Polarella glacialis]